MSLPRVSIIIRSMGRPELEEALASVARQHYDNIEVVLVAASGSAHPKPPPSAGRFPVVYVPGETRRPRPVAANAGLDHASGAYLGFLDDDDTLTPEHVSGLVHALEANPQHKVAFVAAVEVRPGGVVWRVGNVRISRLALLEQCFFPPCAALFRLDLLAHCRFDETLDAAEDWDFWIQTARHTEFLFVPQESAVYRADRGRSAMSGEDGGVSAEAQRWNDAVRRKWANERLEVARAVEARFAQALAHLERSEHALAETAVDDTLRAYPYHVGALRMRGAWHAQRGDYAAAANDFDLATQCRPNDPELWFQLADAWSRQGARVKAEAFYRRVLTLDPMHVRAHTRLAELAPGR